MYNDGVLAPMFSEDGDALSSLRPGGEYMVSITVPRNIRFHRKFFALLRITLDNMPDSIRQVNHIHSTESLLAAIKIAIGHFDTINIHEREVFLPRSISFSKMDNAEFSKFYNRAVDEILSTYLVGTDRNDLLMEIESQFVGYK